MAEATGVMDPHADAMAMLGGGNTAAPPAPAAPGGQGNGPAAPAGAPNAAPAAGTPAPGADQGAQGAPGGKWNHLFRGAMNALGGVEERPVEGPNGTIVNQKVELGRGAWARKLLAGALAGLGAASEAPEHVGAPATTGIGAGFAGEQKNLQGQADQQRQQVAGNIESKRKQTEIDQETQLRQAQTAYYTMQNADLGFDLARKKVKASEDSVNAFNAFEKAASVEGATSLGTFPDINAVYAYEKNHPELHAQIASGEMFAVAAPDGVHAAIVPRPIADRTVQDVFGDKPIPGIPNFVPGAWDAKAGKQAPGHWEEMEPAEGTKYGDYLNMLQRATLDAAKSDNEKTQAQAAELGARAQSEIAKGQAALENAKNKATGGLTPDEFSSLADAIYEGRADLKQVASMRSDVRSKLAAEVLTRHKDWNQQGYQVALKTMDDFTSGKTSANITALNTAIGHLDMLGQAAESLKNGDLVSMNRIANQIGAATGESPIATYNAIRAAVEGEVAKTYKGSGATDQEVATIGKAFDAAQSPAQARAAVSTTLHLFGSRLQALGNQFKNGTGKTPDERGVQLVSPEAKSALQRWGIGGGPAPAAHVIALNGKQYQYNGSGDTADIKNYTEVKQ